MRYPKDLQEGGSIGFPAPSFGCAIEPYYSAFQNSLKKWKELGYKPIPGPNAYAMEGMGISNTPQKCAEEFMQMYLSKEYDVLISCGGGDTAGDADYTFEKGKTVIAIHGDMEPILAALGDWNDYEEKPSCGFSGISKLYVYGSFEIETYPVDGKDYVYRVELYDDTVATAEGIRIGQTREQVIETYGEADKESTTLLTYRAPNMYLRFRFSSDGLVSKIIYLHPNAIQDENQG
jgi:hypothetical protein